MHPVALLVPPQPAAQHPSLQLAHCLPLQGGGLRPLHAREQVSRARPGLCQRRGLRLRERAPLPTEVLWRDRAPQRPKRGNDPALYQFIAVTGVAARHQRQLVEVVQGGQKESWKAVPALGVQHAPQDWRVLPKLAAVLDARVLPQEQLPHHSQPVRVANDAVVRIVRP
jgi:hypothetical protein